MLTIGLGGLPGLAASMRRSLPVCTGLIVAVSPLACGAVLAHGEAVPPNSSGAVTCPSPNPANALTLLAGTPQTATLGSAFATNLQVAFTNSNGCAVTSAVAGTPVTFSAPAAGASGLFSASGSNIVTVGSDASGMAASPLFTADNAAGTYTVTASSAYGSVSFSLTNAAAKGGPSACGSALASLGGRPVRITVGVGATESTRVRARFPIRLAVTVTDAEKDPVPGAQVTFSAPGRGPSGRFATRSRGPHPTLAKVRTVKVRTDACGIAVAPSFVANNEQGGYIVKVSIEHVRPAAFALVNEGR
jgi:hypothetical protein